MIDGLLCTAASKQSQKDCHCRVLLENTGMLSLGNRVTFWGVLSFWGDGGESLLMLCAGVHHLLVHPAQCLYLLYVYVVK